MKKINYFILVFTSLVLINFSCETKNDTIQDSELEAILFLIDNSELQDNALILKYDDGELISEIQDAWEYVWQEETTDIKDNRISNQTDAFLDPGDELCRGGGVRFAKCVRDVLNSEKCVLIFPDGDVFVAEEAACP